ncbi:hypothetical protein ABPG75_004446 [Micractinium tetrahymenae]
MHMLRTVRSNSSNECCRRAAAECGGRAASSSAASGCSAATSMKACTSGERCSGSSARHLARRASKSSLSGSSIWELVLSHWNCRARANLKIANTSKLSVRQSGVGLSSGAASAEPAECTHRATPSPAMPRGRPRPASRRRCTRPRCVQAVLVEHLHGFLNWHQPRFMAIAGFLPPGNHFEGEECAAATGALATYPVLTEAEVAELAASGRCTGVDTWTPADAGGEEEEEEDEEEENMGVPLGRSLMLGMNRVGELPAYGSAQLAAQRAEVSRLFRRSSQPAGQGEQQAEAPASEQQAPGTQARHSCSQCGMTASQAAAVGAKLRRCSRCRQVRYCSKACQRAAWLAHRKVCQQAAARLATQPES